MLTMRHTLRSSWGLMLLKLTKAKVCGYMRFWDRRMVTQSDAETVETELREKNLLVLVLGFGALYTTHYSLLSPSHITDNRCGLIVTLSPPWVSLWSLVIMSPSMSPSQPAPAHFLCRCILLLCAPQDHLSLASQQFQSSVYRSRMMPGWWWVSICV